MEEAVKIKVKVSIGIVGGDREVEASIDRKDWDEMNDEQRNEFVWDAIIDSGVIDFGWEEVNRG